MQVKCTSCGAQQNISEAKNCDFCGNVIELESATNNYKTALSGESGNLMAMAETAIEATNWEEALQYFNRVLEKDITNSDAWLGKGIAIVYTSKIGDIKITEAIAYWKNALKHAANQEAMGKRVAKEINEVVNKFYPSLENHFIQFKDLDNSYGELVAKFVILEKAQEYATQLDSTNIKLYETGYALCKRVIQIPKQQAISDEGDAWAQGIIGAVQDNKYKRQDAVQQINKAKARKKEIETANAIITELEMKYISGIQLINPEIKISQSISNNPEQDDYTIEFVTSRYQKSKSLRITVYDVEKKFKLKNFEADRLVIKILKAKNLITEEEIANHKRGNIVIVILAVLTVLTIGIVLFLLNKK